MGQGVGGGNGHRVDQRDDRAAGPGVRRSERLARRMFELSSTGRHREQLPLIHPEAELELAIRPDQILSRDGLADELERAMLVPEVATATAHTFVSVDDERVAVAGRLRWPSGNGFRDSAVSWAFEFRDGLLYRSWSAPSLDAAIARLHAAAAGAASANGANGSNGSPVRAGLDPNLRPTD